MQSNVIDWFKEEINQRIEDKKNVIAAGLASDFNEYHRVVGEITGMSNAKDILLELVNRALHDDNDED